MNIKQIKNSLGILNNMDEKSINDMFEKYGIDEKLSMKGVKEGVKGGVFNILK